MQTQQHNNLKAHTIAFRVTEEQYQHLLSFARAEGYKFLSQWMHQLVKDEIADRLVDND